MSKSALTKDPRSGTELPEYHYEPDETPKRKHGWSNDWAGFVRRGDEPVAKCPSGLSNGEAKALLNDGIPWFNPRAPGPHPDKVYVVRHGVVYRAVPTRPGVSSHGFPEKPDEVSQLPKPLRTAIVERARLRCELAEYEEWMSMDPGEDA